MKGVGSPCRLRCWHFASRSPLRPISRRNNPRKSNPYSTAKPSTVGLKNRLTQQPFRPLILLISRRSQTDWPKRPIRCLPTSPINWTTPPNPHWLHIRVPDTAVAKAAKSSLTKALNKIINGPSVYDAERFKNISLRPQTQELLKQSPDWQKPRPPQSPAAGRRLFE